jgi:hypothetical protein
VSRKTQPPVPCSVLWRLTGLNAWVAPKYTHDKFQNEEGNSGVMLTRIVFL